MTLTPERIIPHIRGLEVFIQRGKNRLTQTGEAPDQSRRLLGVRDILTGPPGYAKTVLAKEITESWAQDPALEQALAKRGEKLTCVEVALEDCLPVVRRRADVLGMDYGAQSQDYILAAASHLAAFVGYWIEDNIDPPWHATLQLTMFPFPYRDYGFTSARQLIQRAMFMEDVFDRLLIFTPTERLFKKILADRQKQQEIDLESLDPETKEATIKFMRSRAPIDIMKLIYGMSLDAVDYLHAEGYLPNIPKNFRSTYQGRSAAIEALFDEYCKLILSPFATPKNMDEPIKPEELARLLKERTFRGTNDLIEKPVTPHPDSEYKVLYTPNMEYMADLCFGNNGLGAFTPADTFIKAESPGKRWLIEQTRKPYQAFVPDPAYIPGKAPFLRPEKREDFVDPNITAQVVAIGNKIISEASPYFKPGQEIVLNLKDIKGEGSIYTTEALVNALNVLVKEKLISIKGNPSQGYKLIIKNLARLQEFIG